jgi:large subunit ribosomal protein L4
VSKELKKFNLKGDEVGAVQVDDALFEKEASSQSIKDYIVALRANARQWSANTKGRSEVNHSTKKPHPQKGGGRSRQGSLAAPHYKGGGRVFAPKPKFDQHVKINQKERRAACASLIAEKIKNDRMIVLDTTAMGKVKTKDVASFLKKMTKGKRTLIIGEGSFEEIEESGKKAKVSVQDVNHSNFKLSLRNIPMTSFRQSQDISGYDVIAHQDVVITEKALKQLQEHLLRK